LEFETISKSWYKYDENVYNRNGEYVDGDSLPDKNFLHIDEGGTNIADDNFENLDALFEYVKNDFKVKP